MSRPNEELTYKLTIKVTRDMRDKIEYLAKCKGESVSEYVREILKKATR